MQMNKSQSYPRNLAWCAILLMSNWLVGCDRDPVLGTGDIAISAPTVTSVAPADNAVGVPIDNAVITTTFSEPIAPLTGAASFTVTCAAPCTSPAGTVALDATNT